MLDVSIFDADYFLNHKPLKSYFAQSKNSKIYLFYTFLRCEFLEALQSQKSQDRKTFCIDKQKKSYEFDITQKTIKNWLNDLQKQGFIKFKYIKFNLVSIEMLDYTTIASLYPKLHKENGQKILPTRFYKDVQLILKKVIDAFDGEILNIEGGEFFIRQFVDKKDLSTMQNVFLRFKEKQNQCFEVIIPYKELTGKDLPDISCNYHKAIIKKRIITALNNYIISSPNIGGKKSNLKQFQNLKVS